MNKTGLVMEVKSNTAILLTSSGEFVKVCYSGKAPIVGETYTGIIKNEKSLIKQLAAAIVLFVILISGGGTAYAYFTPVATVQVNINPSIEIKVNRFDKIIESVPMNNDGKTLLQKLQLKNKNINEALILVVEEAKKENFINKEYISKGKTISITISSKNANETININKFQKYIEEVKINTHIDDNGKKSNRKFIKNDKNIDKETTNNINNDSRSINSEKINNSNQGNEKNNKNNNGINNEVKDNNNIKSSSKNNNGEKTEVNVKENENTRNIKNNANNNKHNGNSEGNKGEITKTKK